MTRRSKCEWVLPIFAMALLVILAADATALVYCAHGENPRAIFNPDGTSDLCLKVPERLSQADTYCWECREETGDLMVRAYPEDSVCPVGKKTLDKVDQTILDIIVKSKDTSWLSKSLKEGYKIGCETYILGLRSAYDEKSKITDINNNGVIDAEDSYDVIIENRYSYYVEFAKKYLEIPKGARIVYQKDILYIFTANKEEAINVIYDNQAIPLDGHSAIIVRNNQPPEVVTEGIWNRIKYNALISGAKISPVVSIAPYRLEALEIAEEKTKVPGNLFQILGHFFCRTTPICFPNYATSTLVAFEKLK